MKRISQAVHWRCCGTPFQRYIIGSAISDTGTWMQVMAQAGDDWRLGGGSLVRYAAAVGMIWGIFLGRAVMAFSILLVTVIHAVRITRRKSDAQQPD